VGKDLARRLNSSQLGDALNRAPAHRPSSCVVEDRPDRPTRSNVHELERDESGIEISGRRALPLSC